MPTISHRELPANAGLAAAINPEARAQETTHPEQERAGVPEQSETNHLFFNREEAQFIEAAADIENVLHR